MDPVALKHHPFQKRRGRPMEHSRMTAAELPMNKTWSTSQDGRLYLEIWKARISLESGRRERNLTWRGSGSDSRMDKIFHSWLQGKEPQRGIRIDHN